MTETRGDWQKTTLRRPNTDTDERPLNRGSAEASNYKRPADHRPPRRTRQGPWRVLRFATNTPSQPRSTLSGDIYGDGRWQNGFSTEQLVWSYGHCGGHAWNLEGFGLTITEFSGIGVTVP